MKKVFVTHACFSEIDMNLVHALEKSIIAYMSERDIIKVFDALVFTVSAHSGQKRMTGEPYAEHPIRIATHLADYKIQLSCVLAALLHDTVEDAGVSEEEIAERFGQDVAHLVIGLTKFSKDKFREAPNHDRRIESIRKMFLVMQDDVRIPVIKAFDRYDNSLTFDIFREDKTKRLVQETVEVYGNLAEHFLLKELHFKMMNECIKHHSPSQYVIVKDKLQVLASARERILKEIQSKIFDGMDGLGAELILHPLSPADFFNFSTYKFASQPSLDSVHILCTLKSKEDCYKFLNVLHHHYIPLASRISDTLHCDVPNKEKELSSTVFGPLNVPCTFHIVTEEFAEHNAMGIVTDLLLYKDDKPSNEYTHTNVWMPKFVNIKDMDGDSSEGFWSELKGSFLAKNILVRYGSEAFVEIPQGLSMFEALLYIDPEQVLHVSKVCKNGIPVDLNKKLYSWDHITVEYANKEPAIDPKIFYELKTSLGKKKLIKRIREECDDLQIIEWGKVILRGHIFMTYFTNMVPRMEEIEEVLKEQFEKQSIDELRLQMIHDKPLYSAVKKYLTAKSEEEFQFPGDYTFEVSSPKQSSKKRHAHLLFQLSQKLLQLDEDRDVDFSMVHKASHEEIMLSLQNMRRQQMKSFMKQWSGYRDQGVSFRLLQR